MNLIASTCKHVGVSFALLLFSSTLLGQQSDSSADPSLEIDHLTPGIDFEIFGSGYHAILKQQLLNTPADCARMIIVPSAAAEGESAISVYSKRPEQSARTFYVTYAKAARDIWSANEEKRKRHVPIKRITAEIPIATASAICLAWKAMLSKTAPYEKDPPLVIHPTLIEFSVIGPAGEIRGQLPWHPGKRPTILRQLGEKLVQYCQATAGERNSLARVIEQDAKKLSADLEQ